MNEHGPHSTTPYYTRWDSWNAALEAAGLEPNHREVSDDKLLADLRRLADEYGEPVLYEDAAEHGEYDPSTYLRRFDSWFDARERAGLEIVEDVRPGRRVDEADLLEALRELAMDLGRKPSQMDMNRSDRYSQHPYIDRWGSWNDALEAAGIGSRE